MPEFLKARITANDHDRDQRLYIVAQSMFSYTRSHTANCSGHLLKNKENRVCNSRICTKWTGLPINHHIMHFSKTIVGIVGSKAFRICSRTHSSINVQRSFKTGDMPEVGSEGSHTKSHSISISGPSSAEQKRTHLLPS